MRNLLFTLLLFCCFTNVSAQNDSLLPDSLALPRITLFSSASVFNIFSPAIPLDAGCEFRLQKHMTLSVSGGFTIPGIFGSRTIDPFGYGFGVEPRYYFLRKNAAYVGILFSAGIFKQSATIEIPDGNLFYYRRSRITKESFCINPMFGWYGVVNPKVRFPIGIAVGLRLEFRNFYYSNLSPHEINLISNKKLYSAYSNGPISLMAGISTPIGWVIKR